MKLLAFALCVCSLVLASVSVSMADYVQTVPYLTDLTEDSSVELYIAGENEESFDPNSLITHAGPDAVFSPENAGTVKTPSYTDFSPEPGAWLIMMLGLSSVIFTVYRLRTKKRLAKAGRTSQVPGHS